VLRGEFVARDELVHLAFSRLVHFKRRGVHLLVKVKPYNNKRQYSIIALLRAEQ
jgi:hypothetical protein